MERDGLCLSFAVSKISGTPPLPLRQLGYGKPVLFYIKRNVVNKKHFLLKIRDIQQIWESQCCRADKVN